MTEQIKDGELRWLITRNKPTSNEIRAYKEKYGVSMVAAKRALTNEQAPLLQVWRKAEAGWHEDFVKAGGYWDDVQIVEEGTAASTV